MDKKDALVLSERFDMVSLVGLVDIALYHVNRVCRSQDRMYS